MSKPSVRSRLVKALLRLIRRKQRLTSVENAHRAIAKNRAEKKVTPSTGMRSRVNVSHSDFEGMEVVRLLPRTGTASQRLLFLHGGCYTFEMVAQHWSFLESLVHRLQCRIDVPLYPLAPEHTAPDVFALLLPLYRKLFADGPPDSLYLMGDSAGGGLALGLAQSLGAEGLSQPRALLLLSPWVDLALEDEEIAGLEEHDVMLSAPGLRECGRLYAGRWGIEDPRVSPLRGVLRGLAPTTVFIGGHDILVPSCRRLRARAEEQGAELRYFEAPGMSHDWMLMPIPEAEWVRDEIVRIVREDAPSAG
jgi:monoterpene epsilon-lactone hydrolase